MSKVTRLTPLAIERAKAKTRDLWLSDDEGTRGGGRLVVRVSTAGTKLFYFRYSVEGRRKQIPLRPFSPTPAEGRYTLDQARQAFRRFSELHRRPESQDVAAHLKAEEEARLARQRAADAEVQREKEKAAQTSRYTLRALCDWYVRHLEDAGKASHANVKSVFKCHVEETDWADQPAKAFSAKQATALVRKVVEGGKGRTAGKLRSMLHSAFALAMKAELDPSAPAELMLFGIEHNPIAATAALSKFNRPRDRVLTASEMGAVWRRLSALNEAAPLAARALRLTMLLGGQRAQQLLRVRVEQVDLEAGTITLFDPKGRRQLPRAHTLPLAGAAKTDVLQLMARCAALPSQHLFGSRGSVLGSENLSHFVRALSDELIAEKISTHPFQFRDMRRTAETMMASLGVSKDIRAQIQSHGLSGVQTRHYDKYEYMAEKRQALKTWEGYLALLMTQAVPDS